jgi:hypothetical protein
MKYRVTVLPALSVTLVSYLAFPAAFAASDFQVQTGQGEEVRIKQSLLGTSTFKAQDRIGDKVEHTDGWFGTGKTEVKVLGNGVVTQKGIFGRKTTVTTMLGDKVESHRTWFGLGPRKTTVNLSGTSSLIGQLLGKKTPVGPSGNLPSGAEPNSAATESK